jgi:PAS domain S-box-containing protein
VLVAFVLIIFLHYPQHIRIFKDSPSLLGLERHALERILFLLPLAYAAYFLGLPAGIAALVMAAGAMLPRALLVSLHPRDALFETAVTLGVGVLINAWLEFRRKEIGRREQTILRLEAVRKELQSIGKRYQEIFEKANDAIWIHDGIGKIISANQACDRIFGYESESIVNHNLDEVLLPEETLRLKSAEESLLAGAQARFPTEYSIQKRTGSQATVMLSLSLLGGPDDPLFLIIARDTTQERRLKENLRYYASQIGRAHEEERKRIARELHDDTIQILAAVARRLDTIIARKTRQDTGLRFDLEGVLDEINRSLLRARRFIQSLRPPTLDFLGLVPALRELTENMEKQYGMEVTLHVGKFQNRGDSEKELLTYRIIQEALQNAGRHAEATRAVVTIESSGRDIRIAVKDDGKGFQVPPETELMKGGKLGLMGMKERAQLLGGDLALQSSAAGTEVVLHVPADAYGLG